MSTEFAGLLARVVALLDDAGVPFMVAGSFASTAHGLPRTTQDLDLVINPPSAAALDALVASMAPDDYYVDPDAAREALGRRLMFNVVDQATGWKVDLIIRKNRPFSREEFARRTIASLLGVPVFLATAEDTVVAKLEWSKLAGGSERQRRDVAGILAASGDVLDRSYVERWARSLDSEDEWRSAQRTSH